jgi:peptide deformylase
MKISKNLVSLGDPVLHHPAGYVPARNPEIFKQLSIGLNRAAKRAGGVGLALPQIGVPLRGFMIASHATTPAKKRFCFNPKIISKSAVLVVQQEGCLSIDKGRKQYWVSRHADISVEYTNQDGKLILEDLSGLASRVFQHEYDHLDGVLISERGTEEMPKPTEPEEAIPPSAHLYTRN